MAMRLGYPGHRELDDVPLCFVHLDGGSDGRVAAAAAYEPLADFFHLKHYERVAPRRGGHRGKEWHMRDQLAWRRLVNRGLKIKPSREGVDRGSWTLSPEDVCRARYVVGSPAWKDEEKVTSLEVEEKVTSLEVAGQTYQPSSRSTTDGVTVRPARSATITPGGTGGTR